MTTWLAPAARVSAGVAMRRGAFILFPQSIEFGAYQVLFTDGSRLATGFFFSVARILVGTALNLFFTATLAYVLSRRGLPGRVGMTLFVFVTMIISGGLIPTFFLIDRIGMTNTFWAMVIPFLVSPWNMLIMRNFFMALPESLGRSGDHRWRHAAADPDQDCAPPVDRVDRHHRPVLRRVALERVVLCLPLH